MQVLWLRRGWVKSFRGSFRSRAELRLVPVRAVLRPAAGWLLEGLVVACTLLMLLLMLLVLMRPRKVLLARESRLGKRR